MIADMQKNAKFFVKNNVQDNLPARHDNVHFKVYANDV